MLKNIIFLLLSFGFLTTFAQVSSNILLQKCFGGSNSEFANSIAQTSDSGYIISGYTSSKNGDITLNHGLEDYWIIKTNEYSQIQWQKTYGGSNIDIAESVQQTIDGGYIFTGYTLSDDGDVTGKHGNQDCWVVKTDETGAIEWQKCYGGSYSESATSIIQTYDGGYIFSATSSSNDGDLTINKGDLDIWIVKIDYNGAIQWQKSYGGIDYDYCSSIKQVADSGYILLGSTGSFDGDMTSNYGKTDVWVAKINQTGILEWQKSYGGSKYEYGSNISLTADGGYIFAATSESTDGELTKNNGYKDFWLVKITSTGKIIWQKSYGGSYDDLAKEVIQTNDGGYIISGQVYSFDKDITGNHGASDAWIVKTDSMGNIKWQRALGGTSQEAMEDIIQTYNGGFVCAGFSASNNGNVSGSHGAADLWLVRLCTIEALALSVNNPEYCVSAEISATPGFEHYLWNTGDTTPSIHTYTGGYFNVVAASYSGCESIAEITIPQIEGVYDKEEICIVTVDELTGKNMIQVHKTLNVGTDSILIFRAESFEGQYHHLGSIAFDSLNVFTDENVQPSLQTYSYKIACKNNECISDLSEAHRTMLLTAQYSSSNRNEVKLSWSDYYGADYTEIQVFRSNSGEKFELIASIAATTDTYFDLNAPAGTNSYVIRVPFATACAPSSANFDYSSSNIAHLGTYGINEDWTKQISIYPNPASDELNIEIKNSNHTFLFEISDITGRVILTGIAEGKTKIDISMLKKGLYMMELIGNSDRIFKFVK